MNITANHVTLLLHIKRHNGYLTIPQAERVDQRTLGSACTTTRTRRRTVEFDWRSQTFQLTETGLWVLHHDIDRRAANYTSLSLGVLKLTPVRRKPVNRSQQIGIVRRQA